MVCWVCTHCCTLLYCILMYSTLLHNVELSSIVLCCIISYHDVNRAVLGIIQVYILYSC